MSLEKLSDLDLAYLEGFVQKCSEANVDPEPLLAGIISEAQSAQEIAKDVKGPEKTVDEGMAAAGTPEKQKKVLKHLRTKKADIDAIIEKIALSAAKGISKKKRSATVRAAKKGKDIGKPGKKFKQVAEKARKGGARDPEAVAAAAMWKNIKKKGMDAKTAAILEKLV